MKKLFPILLFVIVSPWVQAQKWVDTTYQINSDFDITYGSATDFKGANYSAELDVSVPLNDTPPQCGRPLIIVVHGGAWYGGDKADGYANKLREDFAKRGYVAASVNYRQGLFNTNKEVDCVLDGWKCWNMTDSTEWYRANYRAIQDVRGAVRYLVNNKESYIINPDNIFLVGESAGGFIVMGVGFMDDPSEVLNLQVEAMNPVSAPNKIYENACIKKFGLANSISEMSLDRTHLGSADGDLNQPAKENYRIRGVGSFYGGVFNNIFQSHTSNSPALYMFHQPCDLIVPMGYNKLLAGYNKCATEFPTFCQHIINRPFMYGSKAIATFINDLKANNIPTCDYLFDNSGKTYSCAEQVVNPALGCHALDNYGLRTRNMANFFAGKMGPCSTSHTDPLGKWGSKTKLYPNPIKDQINLDLNWADSKIEIRIVDAMGKEVFCRTVESSKQLTLDVSSIHPGVYQVWVLGTHEKEVYSIIKL